MAGGIGPYGHQTWPLNPSAQNVHNNPNSGLDFPTAPHPDRHEHCKKFSRVATLSCGSPCSGRQAYLLITNHSYSKVTHLVLKAGSNWGHIPKPVRGLKEDLNPHGPAIFCKGPGTRIVLFADFDVLCIETAPATVGSNFLRPALG